MTGVINTMKDNITKVLERGDKLEDLEEKSGILFIEKNYLSTCFFDNLLNFKHYFNHTSSLSLSLYLFATGELAESASQFRVSSRRLERKMWWKNCKVLVGNNRSFFTLLSYS